MKYKKASKNDLTKVFNILQAVNRKLILERKFHWKGLYTKEKILSSILYKKVFLAFEDGKPIGTFTLCEEKPSLYKEKFVVFYEKSKGKTLYLSALAVIPSLQNKGYGKKIINFIEKKSLKDKFSSITFDVVSNYKAANVFYKKLGYRIIGKINGKIRKGNIYTKEIYL